MIKVGVSRSVAKRRSSLANASPETLSILKTIETNKVLAFHVESGVKVLLRQFRIRGEWFKCSDTLALLALRAAEQGELECRSRMATEIKRQRLRMLDAETVAALTLPEGKWDVVFFDRDLTGFGFRLRQRGGHLRKSWIVQYRVKTTGRGRRALLGSAAVLSASEARAAARQLLAQVALGRDPQGEKKAKREQTRRHDARRKSAALPAKAIAHQLLVQGALDANPQVERKANWGRAWHRDAPLTKERQFDPRAKRLSTLRSPADDQVLTLAEWYDLAGISKRTGRRILQFGDGPRVVRLSDRRLGISVAAHREWVARKECAS
jgi:hypothetical protein